MNTAGSVSFLIGLRLRPYVTAETSIIVGFLGTVMDRNQLQMRRGETADLETVMNAIKGG